MLTVTESVLIWFTVMVPKSRFAGVTAMSGMDGVELLGPASTKLKPSPLAMARTARPASMPLVSTATGEGLLLSVPLPRFRPWPQVKTLPSAVSAMVCS